MTNEREFSYLVLALAERVGVLAHWCADSRRCVGDRGFPDLTIVGSHGVIFAELKTDRGMTSAEQDLWIWTADRAGIRAVVWRPDHLIDGTIERLMEAIR